MILAQVELISAEHVTIALMLFAGTIAILWSWHRELYLRQVNRDYQDALANSIKAAMASTQGLDEVTERIKDLNQLSKEQRGELIALLLNIEQRSTAAMDQVRGLLSRSQSINFNSGAQGTQIGEGNRQG